MQKHNINHYLIKDLENRLKTNNLFEWIDCEGEQLANLGLTHRSKVDFTNKLRQVGHGDCLIDLWQSGFASGASGSPLHTLWE
jgi:hypothetical protein